MRDHISLKFSLDDKEVQDFPNKLNMSLYKRVKENDPDNKKIFIRVDLPFV